MDLWPALLIVIAPFIAFHIWMIVHLLRSPQTDATKAFWLIIIVIFEPFGAIVYFFTKY